MYAAYEKITHAKHYTLVNLIFNCIIIYFNRGSWPKTSYMKAADIWTLFCYIGVFCSLAEYCVILYLTKKPNWETDMAKVKADKKVLPNSNPNEVKLFNGKVPIMRV
jgi:hypothetical protein